MAMVALPSATLTFTLRDASGSQSQMEFKVPTGTLKEAALLAADALRPLVAALTDAAIVGQSLTYGYSENAPVPQLLAAALRKRASSSSTPPMGERLRLLFRRSRIAL